MRRLPTFCVGFAIGSILALSVLIPRWNSIPERLKTSANNIDYHRWFQRKGLSYIDGNHKHADDNTRVESVYLKEEIAVYCLIMVRSKDYVDTANATWMTRCTDRDFIVLSTKSSKGVEYKKTRQNSTWARLCAALQKTPVNDLHWLLIVYDNTFVILENLRYLLAPLDYHKLHYLGHAVMFWNVHYNSGEAGFVLSRGVLIELLRNKTICNTQTVFANKEDYYLGKYLTALNATPIDTRDSLGLSRFHKYTLSREFLPVKLNYQTSIYPVKCCSQHAIAFQVASNNYMYLMNYITYTVTTPNSMSDIHRSNKDNYLPWKAFLRERGLSVFNITPDEYFELWKSYIDPSMLNANMKSEYRDINVVI